jgi:hypothetical protein
VINDASGQIVLAATQKLHSTDVLLGEATATLLATRLASSTGFRSFDLEGDALLVILDVNQPILFSSWQFVARCANFRAYSFAKWAVIHLVFGSIPLGSPILSSLWIKSEKDHSL